MDSMRPLISVQVPVYNIEEYVSECIESICNQSYFNLEIILIDDGSTDGSGSICDSYASRDERIKVYHKDNGGLVSARKYAIERSNGEYALQLDGDDSVKADMVEKMLARALNANADVVQCGFGSDGGIQYRYPDFNEKLSDAKKKEIIENWMAGTPTFDSQGVTKLCKMKLMKKAYLRVPDDCSYSEDWIFFVELMKEANIISSMTDIFYNYRIRQDSLSHKMVVDIPYLFDNDRMMNVFYERIQAYFPYVDKTVLDRWFLDRRIDILRAVVKNKYKKDIYRYTGDLSKQLVDKHIVIYGAGEFGKTLIESLSKHERIKIAGWVDRNAESIDLHYRHVDTPDALKMIDFDNIVVAMVNEEKAMLAAQCVSEQYSIPMEKIIWKYSREMGLP